MKTIRSFYRFVVLLLCALLAGCVSHPPGWSSKAKIERIVHERVPVGSTKEAVETFFREAGIKWMELPAIPKIGRPNSLSASVATAFSWPVTTHVVIAFLIGEDQKVETIQIIESYTGP